MQIISYLDKNMTSSAYKKEAGLEMLLKQQNFSRAKVRSIRNTAGSTIKDVVQEAAFSFSGLFAFLLKWKTVVLASACIISLSFMLPSFLHHTKNLSYTNKPVSFAGFPDLEKDLLDTAMASFVLNGSSATFDEEGNVGERKTSSVPVYSAPVEYVNYIVQAGDNISSIAKKFGLSNISTLIAVNNISNVRLLRSGQKISIPSIDGLMHTVKKGESLAYLSEKYGVPLENLLDCNDLSSSILQIGDSIFIPGAHLDADSLRLALGELFMSPLGVSWRLSSAYGYRNDPFTGVRSFHTGIDMVAPQGTVIKASMAGKVAAAGYTQVYGNYVILTHSNGYQTLYAHLHTISVKAGQSVAQGSRVGLLGNTGYSTGAHLHFSVYKNGSLVNPLTILK